MPDNNQTKPIATIDSSSVSGFNINVPLVINSTCTVNGTLKIGNIESLLTTITELQSKIRELENRIVALGG